MIAVVRHHVGSYDEIRMGAMGLSGPVVFQAGSSTIYSPVWQLGMGPSKSLEETYARLVESMNGHDRPIPGCLSPHVWSAEMMAPFRRSMEELLQMLIARGHLTLPGGYHDLSCAERPTIHPRNASPHGRHHWKCKFTCAITAYASREPPTPARFPHCR